MKKLIKRAALAYAVKEIAETVIESRRPKKPSFATRALRVGVVAGIAGAGLYLYKSGAFGRLSGDARSTSGPPSPSARSSEDYSPAQPVSAPA